MGNLFSSEPEPEKKILNDANNNSIIRDASGNVITILNNNDNNNNGGGEGGFNLSDFAAVLAPIDKFGNRVRKI